MKAKTIDTPKRDLPLAATLLFAKLFPHGIPDGIVRKLASEGTIPIDEWFRYKGIGRQAVAKLMEIGLVSTTEIQEMDGLSVRLANVLNNVGADTKAKARELIKSGVLKPGSRRNYGEKCHKELCTALGVPLPPPPPTCRCEKCGQPLPRGLANSQHPEHNSA
jgi:hypothetical protein